MQEFDVVIIGGGPAGYVAAIRGAQLGANVALVEKGKLGGTCLHRGCIPTKALHASAKALATTRKAGKFGVDIKGIAFDLSRAVARKDEVVGRLVGGIKQLLKGNGVEVFDGEGFLENKGQVRITRRDGLKGTIRAKKVIIATGSEPTMIPSFNMDGKNILTSTEMLALTVIPKSLLIIGGGVMGCEFAGIFAEFGSKVTIVELLPTILATEDKQVSRVILKNFKDRGIDVYTEVSVERVEATDDGVKTTLADGREFITEKVIVSIGRSFNSQGLGLEGLGVKTEKGRIVVNDRMETNVEGIYAAGDVVGGMLLAHVASAEGTVAVNNALGKDERMDYSIVPAGIFTEPEIASVGLREKDARERGMDVKIGRFPYGASGKALCMGEEEGFVQILVDPGTDKVLGCSIIGSGATELIGEVAIAIKLGAKAKDIAETIHAHPTLPELVLEAAEDVHGMAIHKIGRKG
ncbi:MAG: dihydrolipoyl dehydrogenase [Deltaproteobacteria bacterium]|nr:dihydrolipoyl dehydrogenase [Deltaproteobacteria bacterium]